MAHAEDLFAAITASDADAVRRLLAAHPAAAAARNEAGLSPLMAALYRRHHEIVGLLRGAGAEIDLFAAAALGDVETLDRLSGAGVLDVNRTAPDGFTALHLACFFGQSAVVRRLLQRGALVNAVAANPTRVQPLHSAVAARDREIVELLLVGGAAVNAAQQAGWTALHAAALHGDVEMLRLLRAHGADPAIRADSGQTPRDLARDRGHAAAVELLA